MKRIRFSTETNVYLVVLCVFYGAPVMVEWLQSGQDGSSFLWSDIFRSWLRMAPYVVVFLMHNSLLMPLLLRQGRRVYYFLFVGLVLGLFFFYQCQQDPPDRQRLHRGPRQEMRQDRRPDFKDPDEPPFLKSRPDKKGERRPHHVRGQRELWDTFILVLMLGMNIGVRLFLRQRSVTRRMEELERRNLEQRLMQLRYQMNPHFLMNTLNNIHALVDIDPVQAQQSIVELSRLLRFVLYEADRPTVPLRHEIDFMNHYIALMRVRFDDRVRITVNMPDPVPEIDVPSLLFITFVENAFKHGVSYQYASFIDIALEVTGDGHILFNCDNSKHPTLKVTETDTEGGVGLRNVRQRLKLLYADRFSLDIADAPSSYSVRLSIPIA